MKIQHTLLVLSILSALALSACTHVSGVVLDPRSKKPVPTAVFSIGRPDGLGVFDKFKCDKDGKFDFSISPTDEPYIYVWDSAGDPGMTMQHIDRDQLRTNMTVYMQPSPSAILGQ